MKKWLRALGALLILLLLLVGVPVLLISWIGNPYPPGGMREIELLSDRSMLGLLAVLAWIVWAQFAACALIEIYAAAARRPAPPLPASHGQQRIAHSLVRALFAAGIVATTLTQGDAAAYAGPTGSQASIGVTTPVQPCADLEAQIDGAGASATPFGHRSVVVARGDTLWALAERYLGDGQRWGQIAALNTGRAVTRDHVYRGHSDVLQPGWRLHIPATLPPASATDEITVRSGDTLWDLARKHLGDAEQWPALYQANRGEIGENPDLILPGQQLDLPRPGQEPVGSERAPNFEGQDRTSGDHRRSPAAKSPTEHPDRGTPPGAAASPDGPQTSRTGDRAGDPATRSQETGARLDVEADDHAEPDGMDDNLRVALVAGGGLLATAGLAFLAAGRGRQHRWRRPGRAIPTTPPALRDSERAFIETGNTPTPHRIDSALRTLAADLHAAGRCLLPVGAARVLDNELRLFFTEPVRESPVVGWTTADDSLGWSTELVDASGELIVSLASQPPPYPTLVAVGEDEFDAVWFLNLEAHHMVTVDGDYQAANMVRFMISELALNQWSLGVEVVGTPSAADLISTGLDPERLRVLPVDDARHEALATMNRADQRAGSGRAIADARLDPLGAEKTDPLVLLDPADECGLDASGEASLGAVLVRLGTHAEGWADALLIVVGSDGHASARPWIETFRPYQVTAADAHAMSALMAHSRETHDEPMPRAAADYLGDGIADVAGALLPELTLDRSGAKNFANMHGAAPHAVSLLPGDDEEYIQQTATTAEDLRVLAPRVAKDVAERIKKLDPALDGDLTAWHNPDSRRPRIRVLGPIEVEAWGRRRQEVSNRLAVCTEVAVFLACQEQGATPDQVAEALRVSPKSVRNRIADTRKLLGEGPGGAAWLPDAGTGPRSQRTGVPVYELAAGVQCDADLFRRLRIRAQARGAEGVEDLVAALSLVSGQPFDRARPGGYGWLSETPFHQFLVAAIVDVAHVGTTGCLAVGDTATARQCCEKAIVAAPYEDRPRLDLAAVNGGGGAPLDDALAAIANRESFGRAEDPPPRTAQLIEDRRWQTG